MSDYTYLDPIFLESYRALEGLPLLRDSKPQVREVPMATVLPFRAEDGRRAAGVVDEYGSYVDLSSFDALSPVDSWSGSYEVSTTEMSKVPRVMYLGRLWRHWGHFLMDLVSRLWYVREVEPDIPIVYDGEDDLGDVYESFFRYLGIGAQQLMRIDQPTTFETVVVPECSHVPGRFVYPAFTELFEYVAERALREVEDLDAYKDRDVYLTRTHLKRRIPYEVGEEDLEAIHAANGYEIVAPETLSLAQQIATVRLARNIACLSGTIPHNMMFAHSGASITIFRKSYKPVYRQVGVNQARDLRVCYVDAHISPRPVGASGPFVVDINDNVRRYARDHGLTLEGAAAIKGGKELKRRLWYEVLYRLRNRGGNPHVPIFDGREFVSSLETDRELSRYYEGRW